MDRIFARRSILPEINELRENIKEAKNCMENLEETIGDVERDMANIPAAVNKGSVSEATSVLRTKIESFNLDALITQLDRCEEAIETSLPMADRQAAEGTDSLTLITQQLISRLEELDGFLTHTRLTINYEDFRANLDVARAKCLGISEDAKRALAKLLMNIKGEETKSVWYSKDPVNLCTGNFIFSHTDLKIPGGETFLFRRFYNSVNHHQGILGRDWNHNYEIHLQTEAQEQILSLEDGKEERFIKTTTGVFLPMFQSNGTLRTVEGGYVYCTREQKKYQFDAKGNCISIIPLMGSCITMCYELEGQGAHLTKVQKESGEFFAFTYDAKGFLATVSDHTGRTITYQIEGGLLVAVSTLSGYEHRYQYTAGGKLAAITNPEKTVMVQNEFDEQMRTTKQYFPDGGEMSYDYNDEKRQVTITERNDSKVTYVHDDKFRDVRHVYPDGEERFEYNKLNQRTLFVDKLGNKMHYSYDERGNRTQLVNPLGHQMDFIYNDQNKLCSVAINGRQKVKNDFDSHGNLVKTQDGEGNTFEYQYHQPGKLSRIIQPDGGVLTFVHDERGNITNFTDPSGVVRKFTYDDLNQIVETVDGNGNRTLFSYDSSGNIKQVTNPQGNTRTYTYNANHKVTEITDFDGSVTKRVYNALNRPSKVVDKMGRETVLNYDIMWNISQVTKPDGSKTTFIYDEYNHLVRIRDGNNNVVRYGYDAVGNRTSVTDSLGHQAKFKYDALGHLIEVWTPEGYCTKYEYNAEGQVTRVEDALGNEVHLMYDGNGHLRKETNPMGESRQYTYTVMGHRHTVTDEVGQVTTYDYDLGGRIKQVTYPEGGCARYTYDYNGNIKTYTNPKGHVLTYTYDCLDQVIAIEGSEGERKDYEYDSMGNTIRMTDGRGAVTQYEYSLTGKLTKVIDPLGNETMYRYDDRDRLIEICQYGDGFDEDLKEVQEKNGENARITRYQYDAMGHITKVVDGLGNTETFKYDSVGQLLEKVDRDGYMTKYGYTPSGQIDQIQYADGREVKLSYNSIRQLEEIKDWLGTTTMESDAMNRITKLTYPDGKDVVYTYGTRGERTSITYPDGEKVTYDYDSHTRLSGLNHGTDRVEYEFDETGLLTKKAFPNGVESYYQYDCKGQLQKLLHQDTQGVLDEYGYSYDTTGNRTSITRRRRGLAEESGTYQYEYDLLGRLTGVTRDGAVLHSYTYDSFGNRTGMYEAGTQTVYTYNVLNQLLAKRDSDMELCYVYDKRGNLNQISEKETILSEYFYDSTNQLKKEINASGQTIEYRHDGMGHRIGKSIMEPGTSHALPKEIKYRLDITRQYNNILQKTEAGQKQTYLWDHDVVSLLHEQETEYPQYFLQDELGSPIRLLEMNGDLKESYGYDPFGNDTIQHSNQSQPFGYTGYQKEEETGSYFAQARYYQPQTGNFLAQDMIAGWYGAPITSNRYSYCYNNPISVVDRDGMLPSLASLNRTIADSDNRDNWDEGTGNTADDAAEAVGKPLGEAAGYLVEVGQEYYEMTNEIREIARTTIRPMCNSSLGVELWTYATQTGLADDFLDYFDFIRDEAGIFHTSRDCWQMNFGYNDFYDWVFDAGTDMDKKKYAFPVGDDEEYCIWMWKGDYINLGAGAETGIYKGGEPHWDVAIDDQLPMKLALYDKDGNTIFVYNPTEPQWWITGFDSMKQGMPQTDLVVIGSIDFSGNEELWFAFCDAYDSDVYTELCFDHESKTVYYKW